MLYDYPEYYEVAFSFRDFFREVDFLEKCISKYSDIEVKNVFEIACAHAPHTEELIKRGYHYTGMDINRNMLDYAQYKWRFLKPVPEFFEGDMTKFNYQKKIDFAFVMLGSLYLNSIQEMTNHFDSLSKILKKGGLYFLDWCIQFSDPLQYKDNNRYRIEKNGIEIESDFNIKLLDITNQMYEEVWTINVNDHGRHRTFKMVERNKAITPQEFLKFITERTDFQFVGWWKDWDLDKPISDFSAITRPVALLKKL
ncbi:MAG: class I SAM-dependent methyltransferase [FCB group bacterium]|nr:class I SAM-dependent methyltransferase [FCB group bacterium]